jgi:phage repressor protein C with HTH and peptisase S24 domain
MSDHNTITRLKEYIEAKNISNRAFERSIGLSNGAFATQLKRGGSIGADKLENILHEYPDLNLEWVLTGNGKMYKSEPLHTVKEDEPLPYTASAGIPLVPIEAIAGWGTGETQVMDYQAERYVIPEFDELQVDFMIRVKGGSMYPKYNPGDIIACRKVEMGTFFQWNKVYVLDTDQGALVKRVKPGEDEYSITLVSENKEYDPFELLINQVHGLALVVGVIRFE